ncbi:MAG: T9SS type A sorting domain-containing protein [Bacteroidales bacterium]|nr:T9SS type A sorting domain-containing protein [Bacteroidales bacterium]
MIKKTLTAVIVTLFCITANSQEINSIITRQGNDDNKSHYQLSTTPKLVVDGESVKVMINETEKEQFDISTNELNVFFGSVISDNVVAENITGSYPVIIGENSILTVIGTITNPDPANLVIKDGGQLVFNDSGKDGNSGVKATVEKNIIPYSSKGDKGWYFLAAPMTDFAVTSFTNQAGNGDYDLYRWYIKDDGTPIWYNYKAHDSSHDNEFETNFVSGRGYLAAYETTNLLKMQGTLNAGTTFDFTNELNSNGNFTLLGNPFTYDLKWSDFNNKTGIYNGFAVVDSEDGIIKYAVGDTPIKVGTGFMVYTEEDNADLSFTKGSGSGKSNDILALNLFASNGNGEDNTIIVLDDENGGFAKADNFNTNVPQIYTEKNQTKYGIRNFNTSTKEFNVSFKAAGEGSNTIRLETIGEFDYVHLYDKLLDVDVDMLLEGSYTFEASEDDDTHRFIVRIDKGNTGIDENETENFVNVYNGEIHVSGSGEVQIFDVMGRIMHSEVISGDATISTGGFKGGVYVVRLIGNGWTKTEKIVVRR